MLALRRHGVRDMRLDDIAEPEPGPGQVKVEIGWAGICGTDLALYEYDLPGVTGKHPLFGEAAPHVVGHEFSGRIIEVGAGVCDRAVGDLVAVQPNVEDGTCAACLRGQTNLCECWGFIGVHGGGGGFSEYVTVEAGKTFVLPASFTPETGALVEPLAVAWHAVRLAGAGPGSTAAIAGAGPIGLGLLMCLRAVGAQTVLVSEVSSERRQSAHRLGAYVVDPGTTDVLDEVRRIMPGGQSDSAFDAAGIGAATLVPLIESVRPGGTVVVVAVFHDKVAIDLGAFQMYERNLVGAMAYTAQDYAEVIAAIEDGRLDPAPLVTSRIHLRDVVGGGLERLLGEGRESEIKILVTPRKS